jgi:hypothetical protein
MTTTKEAAMNSKEVLITIERLKELDAMYEAREEMGALGRRPTRWSFGRSGRAGES